MESMFKNNYGILTCLILLLTFFEANAQNLKEKTLNRFGFKEHSIIAENDTIYFYVHQKENSKPHKVVIYLQGTTPVPEPFFEVEETENGNKYFQYFSSDYNLLDAEYIYVIISLPGTPAVKGYGTLDLEKYNSLNSLDYRVFAADTVINHIAEYLFDPEKIIVYGHSEGAFVAPKLATVNERITHIGVWGGSALPDFFDFILFDRKANLKGEQSDSLTQKNINQTIELFQLVAKDSLNTVPSSKNEITEYTNKRWWSYSEPTINHLVKIDIPIYVQLGTEDESSPIESNYLIPLEFARLGKTNLTFNVCVECDHGFKNVKTGKDNWSEIFMKFIEWSNK